VFATSYYWYWYCYYCCIRNSSRVVRTVSSFTLLPVLVPQPYPLRTPTFMSMPSSSLQDATNKDNGHDDGGTQKRSMDNLKKRKPYKRSHAVTVCIVPPPSPPARRKNDEEDVLQQQRRKVWDTVSSMRQRMKDPGYYRWPPHINLLYPFVQLDIELDSSSSSKHQQEEHHEDQEQQQKEQHVQAIVDKLQIAVDRACPDGPFTVALNTYGIFGGKNRGVLWLDPQPVVPRTAAVSSVSTGEANVVAADDDDNPLQRLYHALLEEFPVLSKKKTVADSASSSSSFTPHMTVSHFENKDGALQGQQILEEEYGYGRSLNLSFLLDRIYVLERHGDNGQFHRVAEIAVKTTTTTSSAAPQTRLYNPPEPFPDMPTTEEEWVHEERMKLKQRRKKKNTNWRKTKLKHPKKEESETT